MKASQTGKFFPVAEAVSQLAWPPSVNLTTHQNNTTLTEKPTKARILQAAGEIFAAKGYSHSTVREICDEAGVNVASVNYHFGDKQSLYLETVMAARQSRSQEFPFPRWNENSPPESRLYEFIRVLVKRMLAVESQTWQVRLLTREIVEPSHACREMVENYFRPVFDILLVTIRELAPNELSVAEANRIGFSIIGQCLYYRFASGMLDLFLNEADHAQFSPERLAEHIYQFSLSAIKNPNSKRISPPHQRTYTFTSEPTAEND